MSESEKKEQTPSDQPKTSEIEEQTPSDQLKTSESEKQTPSDQPKTSESDKFLEALKKDGDEGLKEAFRVLSKDDKPTARARVEDNHIVDAVTARDSKISEQNAKEIIQQVNKEGLLRCDEFVETVNLILDLKKDGYEGLKAAFDVMTKYWTAIRSEDVRLAIVIRNPKLLEEKAEDIIQEANEGDFNREEFVEIFKLLEEPGEANQVMNVYKKLKNLEANHEIILRGENGVGKTWTAREVAARAVRKDDFDAAIWVYLNRNYAEDLSLQKSIAHQLSVLGDFEEFVAQEAKKKAGPEEAKKKEPEKNESPDWPDEIAKKEAKTRKDKIEDLIKEALHRTDIKRKRVLFVHDGDGDGENRMKAEIKIEIRKKKPEQKEKEKGGDEQKTEEGGEKGSNESNKKDEGKNERVGEGSSTNKVESKEEQGGEKKSGTDEGEEKVDEKKEEKGEEIEIFFMELKRGEEIIVKLELGSLESYKVLTTTTTTRKHQGELGENEITVKPLTWKNSKSFATQELVREAVKENREELQKLARYFMFRSQRLPSQLLLISRIVAYFGGQKDSGLQKLRNHREMIKKGQGARMFDVLIQGYEEMLPKSVLIDCYSPERPDGHFMYRERPVSFNELICYWIMEGHFGHSSHVDELYMKGHRVLMELMNCGLLQKQEADYVVPSGTTKFNLHIHDYKAFFSEPRPGLGVTFDMSLGRVALGDGRIVTIDRKSDDGKEQIISTLLLDGNRISDEERTTETLSKYKDRVEVLAISDPTSQHFKLPILEMKELHLLALRGCQFLASLEPFLFKKTDQETDQSVRDQKVVIIPEEGSDQSVLDMKIDLSPKEPAPQTRISEKLEKLTVLEISGPCEVESIPDFFRLMPNLKTVNLSHLNKVEHLPPSFYELKHVEFLILRGCSSLKELSSLKNFKELKVLDVSDATSFEKFEDKSLHTNTELQILNLSNTKLKTLPLINQLKRLKFVWLRDCEVLPRIRKIDKMGSLKIFDIAGAQDVERFCDPSLEDLNSLLIVDISGTKIRRLPANIGDPTYLYAKDCPKLRVVPPVEGLKKLEVLDLSGCARLKELRSEFFDKLKDVITVLNLSNTRVKKLPFLSSLTSLRHLQLSECKFLEKLENLSCLEMETLDLSGCEMVELDGGSFDNMINLKILNLSRSGIGPLLSLSKLQSLEELYVRDCLNLNKLLGVEEALNLQVLDYSGTVLHSPPSFKNQENDSQVSPTKENEENDSQVSPAKENEENDSQVSPTKKKAQVSLTKKKAHPKVVGEGIESINTTKLFKDLGFQNNDKDEKWDTEPEEASNCKWIISNSRVDNEEEKLGTPVYGAHFFKLLNKRPSFLTDDLSKFCFLVYPSEAQEKIKTRFPKKNSYSDEVNLREIYMGQVWKEKMEKMEKMERCLEIRQFNELPKTLRSLLAEAEFIVLVDGTFLNSLLDLRVDGTMPMKMKACWIERCNELKYVVAAPEEVKKPEGEARSEEEQRKDAAMAKGEGDNGKKNSAVEKAGESAKSEGDQPKNGEPEKGGGGEEQKNAGQEQSGGDPEKKNEGDESKNGGAADTAGESGKGEGDQQKTAAAEEKTAEKKEEKSEEPAKNEGDQSKNGAASDNAGGEGDQQKSTAAEEKTEEKKEEKSEEPAKNEGDQSNNSAAADNAGGEGDQQKSAAAEEKTAETAMNEGGEKKEEKSEEHPKNEGDAAAPKMEGKQEKNANTMEEEKPVDSAKNEGDQPKNDNEGEAAKIKADEEKNAAEHLKNNLQSLWISDVSKMESICKGDIKSVTFNTLKSLYLEFCPNLSTICTSSSQLPNLETLFIKYCQKLQSLFEDDDPSEMDNLEHLQLWGLDSLEKINCETPSLSKLRVGECPKLEHLISSRLNKLKHQENEGHQNLETLHIKSCDKLKGIFEQKGVVFDKLTELELSGLPEMQNVAMTAPYLSTLRVEDCPSLDCVITGAAGDLKILDVRSCEKMERIIGGGGPRLEKAEEIKLMGLPELKFIGPKRPEEKVGRKIKIWACPELKFESGVEERS